MDTITTATARALAEAFEFAQSSSQNSVTTVKDGYQTFEVRGVAEGSRKDIRLIVRKERPDEVWTAMEIRHVDRICIGMFVPPAFSDPDMTDGYLLVRACAVEVRLRIWDGKPRRKVRCAPEYPPIGRP